MRLSDMGLAVFTIILIIQSYWDLRYKQVPFAVTLVAAGIGFLLSVIGQRDCLHVLCAFWPGVVCLGIGKVTEQAIGYGDGLLLLAMGLYISCEDILAVGMMAVMISGMVAIVCLIFRKRRGKDTLPFVPFILMAWIIYIVSEKGFIYVF